MINESRDVSMWKLAINIVSLAVFWVVLFLGEPLFGMDEWTTRFIRGGLASFFTYAALNCAKSVLDAPERRDDGTLRAAGASIAAFPVAFFAGMVFGIDDAGDRITIGGTAAIMVFMALKLTKRSDSK